MPTITTTIVVKDFKELNEKLFEIQRRIEDLPQRKSLVSIGELIHKRTVKNFLDSESPEAEKWQPLKIFRPGMILIKTGLLFLSASMATMNPTYQKKGLLIDAKLPFYGIFHLTGTKFMPPRVWLGVSKDVMDESVEIVLNDSVDYIVNGGGIQL